MPPKQSDLRRRTALDTGQLARPAGSGARDGGSGSAADDNATAETVLDELHDQLNARIDADVETLAKGALSLVSLAEIGEKDTFKVAQDAFEADARAETMIRAAENLLSLSHTLKLLFLLNDDGATDEAERRRTDEATEATKREIDELRRAVERTLETKMQLK